MVTAAEYEKMEDDFNKRAAQVQKLFAWELSKREKCSEVEGYHKRVAQRMFDELSWEESQYWVKNIDRIAPQVLFHKKELRSFFPKKNGGIRGLIQRLCGKREDGVVDLIHRAQAHACANRMRR